MLDNYELRLAQDEIIKAQAAISKARMRISNATRKDDGIDFGLTRASRDLARKAERLNEQLIAIVGDSEMSK
jgi:hypothetical protein